MTSLAHRCDLRPSGEAATQPLPSLSLDWKSINSCLFLMQRAVLHLVLLQSKGIPNPSGSEPLVLRMLVRFGRQQVLTYLHRHLRKGTLHSLWLIHLSSAAVTSNKKKKKKAFGR